MFVSQICLNLPLDDDLEAASEVNNIIVRLFVWFVSHSIEIWTVSLVCKGDEAEDDDHGLALHLPHLEHLHLSQGQLLKF